MTTGLRTRPPAGEGGPDFARYVDLVPEDDIVAVLEDQLAAFLALLGGISEAQANTRHAPYTWSVKQVIGHITDAERIFAYRALRFARNDATPLPGFDENAYVRNADFDAIGRTELVAEFEALRRSHILFFQNLDAAAWTRTGVANKCTLSVGTLAYVIAGHARHHLAILQKRLAKG